MAEGLVWTCQRASLVLSAAAVAEPSQSILNMSTALATKTARTQENYTLLRQYVQGWWDHGDDAAVTPAWIGLSFALVRATSGTDAGDFGALGTHTGDILMYDCRVLQESGSALDVFFPAAGGDNAGSGINREGRAQRKLSRANDAIWLIAEKDAVTEFNPTLRVAVTLLWKRSV